MERVLAVDLGGTKTAVGIVDAGGSILFKETAPTPLGNPAVAVAAILELSRRVLSFAGPAQGVGLALPGIVDREGGVLVQSPSSGWFNVPFVSMIQEALKLPVSFDNDVNACAWAESHLGSGSGLTSFFWMTISTGIGGAILSEGRFVGGAMSGEIGHLVVHPDGALCGCGNRGCLEAEAAGPAWRRRALALLDQRGPKPPGPLGSIPRQDIDARGIADGARAGDEICGMVLEDVSRMLARGMAAIFNILDPEAILLGGGIAGAFDLLEPAIRRELPRLVLAARDRPLRILPSSLGYDAALIGAASLALFPYKP